MRLDSWGVSVHAGPAGRSDRLAVKITVNEYQATNSITHATPFLPSFSEDAGRAPRTQYLGLDHLPAGEAVVAFHRCA